MDHLGTLNLENLKKLQKEALISIHYEFAVCMHTGKPLKLIRPYSFSIRNNVKMAFYGNTLMKEFNGVLMSMKKERIIQLNDVLFINSNIEFDSLGKIYTLDRNKGLLIIQKLEK